MANDPWAGARQGIDSYTNSMMQLAQLKRQDAETAQRSRLVDLQTEAAQQSVDQNKITLADLGARQNAMVDQYGTAQHSDPLASAYSFQSQQGQEAEQQKAQREKQKYAFDSFTKVQDAVKNRLIDPKVAGDFYHTQMKLAGIDLDGAGVKMEFMDRGSYFSGPVTADALFMVNGKPTPYGGTGTISKARIVGQDPQSGKPIFEMDENTTFAEAKPEAADKFQLTEIPSADGKTAQKMRVNMTDGTMTPLGNPYAVKSQVPNVNVTTTGAAPLAQTTFVDSATGQPLVFDKKTGTYSVATVNGATVAPKPSAMSPEAAGKAQMLEQGATYIPTLRAELFDADGSVNQINVANLTARTWGTRGRELSSLMLDAIEGKLRAESGAAVPEPEVKRAAKRFMPQVGDTAAGIKIKLDNLETYLKGTTKKINNGRGPAKPTAPATSGGKGQNKAKNASFSDLLNKHAR